MKTNAHFWYYLTDFLEWAIFSDIEKIKTHFLMFSNLFSENIAI